MTPAYLAAGKPGCSLRDIAVEVGLITWQHMKNMSWLRSTALMAIALGTVASSACALKSINQILVDPSRYQDREVRVSGAVAESYSFAGRGAYRIDDQSGKLWVISERGVPRNGARVVVKGRVRDGFNFESLGDRINLPAGLGSGLVLMESSHKATD